MRTTIFVEKNRGTHDSGSRKIVVRTIWLEKNSTGIVRTIIFEVFGRAEFVRTSIFVESGRA